jgi:hypothetical protein
MDARGPQPRLRRARPALSGAGQSPAVSGVGQSPAVSGAGRCPAVSGAGRCPALSGAPHGWRLPVGAVVACWLVFVQHAWRSGDPAGRARLLFGAGRCPLRNAGAGPLRSPRPGRPRGEMHPGAGCPDPDAGYSSCSANSSLRLRSCRFLVSTRRVAGGAPCMRLRRRWSVAISAAVGAGPRCGDAGAASFGLGPTLLLPAMAISVKPIRGGWKVPLPESSPPADREISPEFGPVPPANGGSHSVR